MCNTIYNKGFKEYKNKYLNQAGILFATGPSLLDFTTLPNYENSIKVGISKIYFNEEITNSLQYYFFGSFYETHKPHRKKINSLSPQIQKFASVYRKNEITGHGNITPQHAKNINAVPFDCGLEKFTTNIDTHTVLGHSIVFPAIQFMLYSGMTIIYIVGCDCSHVDYFYDRKNKSLYSHFYQWWKKCKEFIDIYYPTVKIISVNPVGLTGMFEDVWTNK